MRLAREKYAAADVDCLPCERPPMLRCLRHVAESAQHPPVTTFHRPGDHQLLTAGRFHTAAHLYKSTTLTTLTPLQEVTSMISLAYQTLYIQAESSKWA